MWFPVTHSSELKPKYRDMNTSVVTFQVRTEHAQGSEEPNVNPIMTAAQSGPGHPSMQPSELRKTLEACREHSF